MGADAKRSGERHRLKLPAGARALKLAEDLVLLEIPQARFDFPENLTVAERDVAMLVVSGRSNAEIAEERGVSVKTVQAQMEAVFRKVGVGSRTELALSLLSRS